MTGFDFDTIIRTAPYVIKVGLVFTVKLTVLSTLGAIILGTLLAMMRLSSSRLLSGVAGGYVNLMRALPLILIIFWFYFLVPYIVGRSEEHTSELQSLMRISYAVFCLKKKNKY